MTVSNLLLAEPRAIPRPTIDARGPRAWVRPWGDQEQAEYERLVDREIALIRARYQEYRAGVLASMR